MPQPGRPSTATCRTIAAVLASVVAIVTLGSCSGSGGGNADRDRCEEKWGVGNCVERTKGWVPLASATSTSTTAAATTAAPKTTSPPTTTTEAPVTGDPGADCADAVGTLGSSFADSARKNAAACESTVEMASAYGPFLHLIEPLTGRAEALVVCMYGDNRLLPGCSDLPPRKARGGLPALSACLEFIGAATTLTTQGTVDSAEFLTAAQDAADTPELADLGAPMVGVDPFAGGSAWQQDLEKVLEECSAIGVEAIG